MTNEEAIELLKNAVPQDESLDEEGLFIEAFNMAIKALKKAETNCPEIPDSCNVEPVEAIPVPWIEAEIKKLRDMGNGFASLSAGQIKAMLNRWRKEQEGERHGQNGNIL